MSRAVYEELGFLEVETFEKPANLFDFRLNWDMHLYDILKRNAYQPVYREISRTIYRARQD